MTKFEYKSIAPNLFFLAAFVLFIFGCAMFGGGSPTVSYKAFADAAKKKDAATMKKYLSAESLKDVSDSAKYLKKTEDEILTMNSDGFFEYVSISNETISKDGKSASIEVVTKQGDLPKPVNFVKEGGYWKVNYGKQKTANEIAKESDNNSITESTPKFDSPADSSPVTISAGEIVSEAQSSGLEKYNGRMLTVTGAELWEIQYSMLHIGAKGGSYASGYIICSGSFSEYMPYASKISDLRKQYKSPGATIRGTFSKVVHDSGYTQVHLSSCVLSNLEK